MEVAAKLGVKRLEERPVERHAVAAHAIGAEQKVDRGLVISGAALFHERMGAQLAVRGGMEGTKGGPMSIGDFEPLHVDVDCYTGAYRVSATPLVPPWDPALRRLLCRLHPQALQQVHCPAASPPWAT